MSFGPLKVSYPTLSLQRQVAPSKLLHFLRLIIFFLALSLKRLLLKTEIQSSALEKEPESLDSQQQIFRDDVSTTSSCCTCSEPTERRTCARRGEVDSAQTRSKLRDNVYFLGVYVCVYLYINNCTCCCICMFYKCICVA